jgi:hypothetical protein
MPLPFRALADKKGAIEDFFAAQNAEEPIEDEEDITMSNPDQNETSQNSNPSGPRTLGGAVSDTSLPEGWGQKKKTLGRVGDWGDSEAGS